MADFFLPSGSTEFFRLFRSKTIVGALTAGTYGLVRIPKFAFVKNIWILTQTAVTGTSIVNTIGFSGNGETADTDFFFIDADMVGLTAGMQDAVGATNPFKGKWFNDASGMITLTAAANWTAGQIIAFTEYAVIH